MKTIEEMRKEKEEQQWYMATMKFRPSFWWNFMLLTMLKKGLISIKTLNKFSWTRK